MNDDIQDDIQKEVVTKTKELLERCGYRDITVVMTRVPDNIASTLPGPRPADEFAYLRVTTHLGTFGILPLPTARGFAIDLTELGLTRKEILDEDGESGKGVLIVLRDPMGLVYFRQVVESMKTAG